jgi:hypothetical protein
MQTTTEELIAANDALRAEFPDAAIVDAVFDSQGFRLTVIPRDIKVDSQTGKGVTVADALADLRERFAADDPILKLRKEAEAHGYALMKLPED